MFIDDQPIGRTTLIGNSFFDLERVEVVKGPQGTLFGRNASAGAISIITNKASTEESTLSGKVSIGDEGQELYEAVGNLAVNDRFAARVAARYDERDGTFENSVNGDELNNRNHTNVRGAIHYDFTDSLVADLNVEHVDVNTRTAATFFDQAFNSKIAINKQPEQDIDATRGTLRLVWDLDDSMTLTSNSSYLDYDITAIPVDADATADFILDLVEPQTGDQYAQEFRLNGATDSMDWFIGVSYVEEQIRSRTTYSWSDFILVQALAEDFTLCESNPGLCNDSVKQVNHAKTQNNSYGIYGDVTWNWTEELSLTVGARYTYDEKDFDLNQPLPDSAWAALTGDALVKSATDGPTSDDDNWDHFDPRIAVDYAFTDDVRAYASIATGYKSGGFNSNPDITLAQSMETGVKQKPASFDEETVTAYEIGVKSRFWDNRAQLNGAIYFNDYKDFQIEDNANLVINILNAAKVESYGLELDGTVLLTENLSVIANYSYLHAEFTGNSSFGGEDISGNDLPRAPQNSGSLILDYDMPIGDYGELGLRGEYIYTDSFYFDAPNAFEQDSYGLVNARISFDSADGRWGVAVIGDNLDDKEYFVHQTLVLDPLAIPATGRLYRVELTAHF
jgi:iron complex outermembrane receptor protein